MTLVCRHTKGNEVQLMSEADKKITIKLCQRYLTDNF